jgi:hypothetical protein
MHDHYSFQVRRCPLLQKLDGPYVAFVGSVKLEGAYLAISQRDVEAEADEARLKKLQEELEDEEEKARKNERERMIGRMRGRECQEQ